MEQQKKHKIMFLCTGNSCRSQMAEGFAREIGRGILEPFSAGLAPCFVHPRAIDVMGEVGIDISRQESKGIDGQLLKQMDMVITLCDHADSSCPPIPPGIKKIHLPIRDPVGTIGPEEEIMGAFRRARDEIRELVVKLIEDVNRS